MLACGPDCGCGRPAPPGLGGILSTVLNVVGAATVGVPIGSIAASQASPGFAPITQTPTQIAQNVAPKVGAFIQTPPKQAPDARSMAVAQAAAPQIAQAMAASGYVFPAGSTGAELAHPNVFDAFGGNSRKLVEYGFVGLGALLLLKAIR